MKYVMSTLAPSVEMKQLIFGWSDYCLFGILIGCSLLIGLYLAIFSKQNSFSEYLYGGKHMHYIPVAISILASFLSGITFLGVPTEVYLHGSQYFAATVAALFIGLISAYVTIPVFHQLQVCSCHEYLEMRFSRTVRVFASALYVISLFVYIPVVVYTPALAFSQVTGFDLHVITPFFCVICITYTTFGGVKAVVWTDTLQFIFTIGSLATVLILGVIAVGGIESAWQIADKGGRIKFFDFNPSPFDRNTIWAMSFGMTFTMLSRFGLGQKYIQRYLAIEKLPDVRKAVLLTSIGWATLQVSCVYAGIIMYARYHDCDPYTAQLVKRNDQTLPYYVMDIAGHIFGLPGIFLAGLVSSALSTMSASLNTLSGTIYENFIDRWITEGADKDAKAAKIMKIMVVIIGLVTIGLIFIIEKLGTVFEMAYGLNSATEGPLLGLFILAMMVPWVGKKGAITGACVGLTFMVWLVGGTQWHVVHKRIRNPSLPVSVENCPYPLNETVQEQAATPLPPLAPEEEPMILFQIAILYFTLIGSVITVAVGCAVSWFLSETDDVANVNPDHVSPVIRHWIPKQEVQSEMQTNGFVNVSPKPVVGGEDEIESSSLDRGKNKKEEVN
ncbi:sodium-coupled monocarboxylate transporter 1-like [Trichogramma pretiosum]|uniref:sodium-coupled monocarboxylate transporter 1-like n=1 Tax=Trichogramma pretiosum TaxID=7493 RepID=UPI0006C97653|nr:sodium-coupled monocarboxylate transporter 1-like [Trichogramma pretiosum]